MGKFILLTILAYFIFRWLDRILKGGKKTQPQGNTRSSAGNQENKTQPHTKSMIKDDVGEYVDFEEVKEDDSEKK
jgi:hypothetical protein